MTSATETLNQAAKQPKRTGSSLSVTASLLITVALSAIVSWLGGVALHRGFGVSVPFVAGMVLVIAFAFFVRLVVLAAAAAWFTVAAGSAFKVAAMSAAGSLAGVETTKAVLDSQALLHMDQVIREADRKDDGGYL